MLKVHRNSKGFTLIELLIVIAIIGILAAIAIPAYTGYTRKAKVQEVIHAMGAVKTAVMAYYTETGVAPDAGKAGSAALINTELGVDVPTKYLASMTATNGIITSTFVAAGQPHAIGGDVDGTNVIMTPDASYKDWTWSGSLPASYRPK